MPQESKLSPEAAGELKRAIAKERFRNARFLAVLRACGVSAFLLLHLVVGPGRLLHAAAGGVTRRALNETNGRVETRPLAWYARGRLRVLPQIPVK